MAPFHADSSKEEPGRRIVTTRRLAAHQDLVWRAWTDPAVLARWWGPRGFRSTFQEFDCRPGGVWALVMHGPDGAEYPMRSVFTEVVAPSRLAFDHVPADPHHAYHATAVLVDESGDTRLVWTMRFAEEAEHHRVKAFITKANEENLDRLEAELVRLTQKDQP